MGSWRVGPVVTLPLRLVYETPPTAGFHFAQLVHGEVAAGYQSERITTACCVIGICVSGGKGWLWALAEVAVGVFMDLTHHSISLRL